MWFYETLYSDMKVGFDAKLILKKKTKYQNLAIYKTKRYGMMLVLDGVVQTTEMDEFIYHEMMSHPALMLHPNPKNVLIIGGGDGGVLREVLKHPKVKNAYLVEIDKDVIDISKKHLKSICKNAFKDKRSTVVVDDGAKFINQTDIKFDVAIVDSSDPIGPAKVLFTKKFYSQINNILNKDGIMIRQSGSSMLQPDELPENCKILKKIFPYTAVVSIAVPTYVGGFFALLMSLKKINPYNVDISKLAKKYNSLKLNTRYYNPQIQLGSICVPEYIRRKTR